MNNLDNNFFKSQTFYIPNKLNSNNKPHNRKFFKFFLFFIGFLFTAVFLLCWNIYIVKSQTNKTIWEIFVSFFSLNDDSINEHDVSLDPIHRIIWISLASFCAGFVLSISANLAQSLIQNPLADSTTLGMVDASIFGIILLKTFFGNIVDGVKYHWIYLLFTFFGSCIILFFLFLVTKKTNAKDKCLKIILLGLIMNIFFRTIIHLMKTYNANSVTSAYALAVGGSENIYELFPNQFQVLKISFLMCFLSFITSLLISKKLNLCELGDEQAQSLGVNLKYLKIVGYLLMLFCTTIGICLAGNISFIGLLSTHIIRELFKTRKYEFIIPMSACLSGILLLFSVSWNILIPQISSSNFILFVGSVALLYLTQKNKSFN